jgi:hypothetical protein
MNPQSPRIKYFKSIVFIQFGMYFLSIHRLSNKTFNSKDDRVDHRLVVSYTSLSTQPYLDAN